MPTKFEELRDKRLPVAIRKIELLGNLGRPSYEASQKEREQIVKTLLEVTLETAKRLRVSVSLGNKSAPPPARPTSVPKGIAEGGAEFEAEVRWAIDAILRNEGKLAANRLKRILNPQG